MTKPVIIKKSGKVYGIKGLYKDPSSDRYFVRYSKGGIDRQLTICPKNQTFSGLEKAAAKGITELKRRVNSIIGESAHECNMTTKDRIQRAQDALINAIQDHWAKRGSSQKHIMRLLRCTNGMCLCSSVHEKDKKLFNEHNLEIARNLVESGNISDSKRGEAYKSINNVFTELIHAEIHTGNNPAISMIKPKQVNGNRETELTFVDASKAIAYIRNDEKSDALKRSECELFLRLCIETGQRPLDIHMWTLMKMTPDRYYQFMSHKTDRKHRVKHKMSQSSVSMAMSIMLMRGGCVEYPQAIRNRFDQDDEYNSFFSYSLGSIGRYLNAAIRESVGEGKTLYSARHFFISEIFRMTQSEFWAEVFTHEGRDVNQKHYLHVDQSQADEIIDAISAGLNEAIENA